MSRPIRIEYEGAYYHVMNRGRGRKAVFHGADYYEVFLQTLAEAHERFKLEVHAYCLMGNHYHLLVKTPHGNLQRAMRHISGVYTQRYNRLKKTDGSLFRGRYKAILVDADNYLLHLSRYIHKNPIEANIVDKLESYRWSSYPVYLGLDASPPWLYTKDVYGQLNVKRMLSKKYRMFVEQNDNEDVFDGFYQKERLSPILGDERFIGEVTKPSDFLTTETSYKEKQRFTPTIEEIVEIVSEEFSVSKAEIIKSKKGRGAKNTPRAIAMYIAQRVGSYRLTEIARYFGLSHYGGVSNAIYRVSEELKNDHSLLLKVNSIINRFDP